jgi:hypothetical protein
VQHAQAAPPSPVLITRSPSKKLRGNAPVKLETPRQLVDHLPDAEAEVSSSIGPVGCRLTLDLLLSRLCAPSPGCPTIASRTSKLALPSSRKIPSSATASGIPVSRFAIFVDPYTIRADIDPSRTACGAASDCINRLTQVECPSSDCRCGEHCQNQRQACLFDCGVSFHIAVSQNSEQGLCPHQDCADREEGLWSHGCSGPICVGAFPHHAGDHQPTLQGCPHHRVHRRGHCAQQLCEALARLCGVRHPPLLLHGVAEGRGAFGSFLCRSSQSRA